ncbi:hypothetical protein K491DRAFT_680250 [Lophiostoma macrostomum CBS 122681]|uniref:Uncharacterized protein n=1 Tax=Lophiostoma macrostomum CBS 122681 TaxID=1314788 RepID=A0A6A6T3R1_9PLEO|nr:hypothetical protein K491DRAFT_680250 [Lophiostoma macrostomum CBS 122681]
MPYKDSQVGSLGHGPREDGTGVNIKARDGVMSGKADDTSTDTIPFVGKDLPPDEWFDWNDVYEEEATRRNLKRQKQKERELEEMRKTWKKTALVTLKGLRRRAEALDGRVFVHVCDTNLSKAVSERIRSIAVRLENKEADDALNVNWAESVNNEEAIFQLEHDISGLEKKVHELPERSIEELLKLPKKKLTLEEMDRVVAWAKVENQKNREETRRLKEEGKKIRTQKTREALEQGVHDLDTIVASYRTTTIRDEARFKIQEDIDEYEYHNRFRLSETLGIHILDLAGALRVDLVGPGRVIAASGIEPNFPTPEFSPPQPHRPHDTKEQMKLYLQSLTGSIIRSVDFKTSKDYALAQEIIDLLDAVNAFPAPAWFLPDLEEENTDDYLERIVYEGGQDYGEEWEEEAEDLDENDPADDEIEAETVSEGDTMNAFLKALKAMMMLMIQFPNLDKQTPRLKEELRRIIHNLKPEEGYGQIENLLYMSQALNTSKALISTITTNLDEIGGGETTGVISQGRTEAWTRSLFAVESPPQQGPALLPSAASLSILAGPRKARLGR